MVTEYRDARQHPLSSCLPRVQATMLMHLWSLVQAGWQDAGHTQPHLCVRCISDPPIQRQLSPRLKTTRKLHGGRVCRHGIRAANRLI